MCQTLLGVTGEGTKQTDGYSYATETAVSGEKHGTLGAISRVRGRWDLGKRTWQVGRQKVERFQVGRFINSQQHATVQGDEARLDASI